MQIGIDIDSNRIIIGLIDSKYQIVKKVEKEITIKDKIDIETFLKTIIINAIYKITDDVRVNDIKKIGISVPGVPGLNKIKNAYVLGIEEYDLGAILQNEFKSIPVVMRNRGICGARAEKKLGRMKDYENCVFLNIGDGIEGGFYIESNITSSQKLFGTELGHITIKEKGTKCICGKRGCFDSYVSIKKLRKDLKSISELEIEEDSSDKNICENLLENLENTKIKKVIDKYLENMTIGLIEIIDKIKPEIICINGNFSNYKHVFLKRLNDKIKKDNYFEEKNQIPTIKIAGLGNEAEIIGAVLLEDTVEKEVVRT